MKRYILSIIIAAATLISCSDELTLTPAVSFFNEKPEMTDSTAVFRLATSFMTDSTERVFPVTIGGTAERGIDYILSADAFVTGGKSPVDSIVVTTLRFGTEKTVTMTVELPEGTEGGKYITSGFTIQDNPAYITFSRDFGILADSASVAFSLTDKAGRKKALAKDIDISVVINHHKSTASEGTDFSFTDSTRFTIKAGETKGSIMIARPDSSPEKGKDRVFLNIGHDELYGDGTIAEMELHLMDRKWSRLHGSWDIDSLVTDSLYMAGYWGDSYTCLDLLPRYNKFDSMEFDLENSVFEPSFYSDLEYYFLDDTYFRTGNEMDLDTGNGKTVPIQTFIIDNTNRYFSAEEKSEDTESYIGFRLTEGAKGTADTLDLYVIDHTSRSFMPELESEGKYAPEKPVAASPGLFINARFTKIH